MLCSVGARFTNLLDAVFFAMGLSLKRHIKIIRLVFKENFVAAENSSTFIFCGSAGS